MCCQEKIIKTTIFFLRNSGSQGLIHHIDCFGYIFCLQSKKRKFCWFHMFLFYGLYFELYKSVLCIYYSTIHFYIYKGYCWNKMFIQAFCFLIFYIHYCCLLSMNTFLASIQQILQSLSFVFIMTHLFESS